MEITFNTPALLFPAISLLLLAYTNQQSYQDPNTPQVYGSTYEQDRYEFDEADESVTHTHSLYDDFQDHNQPQGISFSGEFFDKCSGTTRLSYVHDGTGGFTVVPEVDSLSCGFVPPQPLTCDLTLIHQLTPTVVGANVTATTAAGHGAVRYQLALMEDASRQGRAVWPALQRAFDQLNKVAQETYSAADQLQWHIAEHDARFI